MIIRTGRTAIIAAIALGTLGYALGYIELLVLSVACVAALVLALVVVLVPPRVDLHREIAPLRVTRGERAVGVLTVRSLSRRSQRISAYDLCGTRPIPIEVPRLPPRAVRQAGYQLPTDRRAILDVGPVRWERSDVLGLLRRRQALGSVEKLYIHPRLHKVDMAASGRVRQLDAPSSDFALRGNITFHALREYLPGDDRRTIHWRSSARLGSLMVREYVDTSLPMTTVVLDTRRAQYADETRFEEAIDFAASLVAAAVTAHSPARLITTGGVDVAVGTSTEDLRGLLDRFAGLLPTTGPGFVHATRTFSSTQVTGILVAVGGSFDEADLAALRALAYRHTSSVLVHCVPPLTTSAPSGGLVVLRGSDATELAAGWNEWVK